MVLKSVVWTADSNMAVRITVSKVNKTHFVIQFKSCI